MPAVRVVVPVVLLLLAWGDAAAENRYFADGRNGLWVGASYLSPENADGFGLDAVFTFGSFFDLGLGYAKLTADGGQPVATEFSPHVAFAVVRPTELSAFGLDLQAGVSVADLTSPLFDQSNVDVSGHGFVVGAEAYGRLGDPDGVLVFPALGLAYASATRTVDYGFTSNDTTVDDLAASCTLTALVHRALTVSAGMQVFDETTTWFAGIGGAFRLDRDEP